LEVIPNQKRDLSVAKNQGHLENTGRWKSGRRQGNSSVFFEAHWNGKSEHPLLQYICVIAARCCKQWACRCSI